MSDLDDEEIKATRILNGVDKENNNIEKDVERCKQLIRVEHANWIGISNQLAIAHVVDRVKELEEETEELKQALARNIAKNFTSSKIIDLMSEWLYEDDTSFGYGKLKDINTSEKIKQYFERKATNNG